MTFFGEAGDNLSSFLSTAVFVFDSSGKCQS